MFKFSQSRRRYETGDVNPPMKTYSTYTMLQRRRFWQIIIMDMLAFSVLTKKKRGKNMRLWLLEVPVLM